MSKLRKRLVMTGISTWAVNMVLWFYFHCRNGNQNFYLLTGLGICNYKISHKCYRWVRRDYIHLEGPVDGLNYVRIELFKKIRSDWLSSVECVVQLQNIVRFILPSMWNVEVLIYTHTLSKLFCKKYRRALPYVHNGHYYLLNSLKQIKMRST